MERTRVNVAIRPVRWKKDFVEFSDLEKDHAEFPKSREYFHKLYLQPSLIKVAAEHHGLMVGSLFCMSFNGNLRLVNLLVDSGLRRRGIGSKLLEDLIETMEEDGKSYTIKLFVRETNFPAQLFFRKHKFFAKGVSRGFYEDTGEDAYRMEFSRY